MLLEYQQTLVETEERLARLEAELVLAAAASPHQPLIEALQALRGIGLVTAATLVAEFGDLQRFRHPLAYVGLVPSEHSSGARQRRGRITKMSSFQIDATPGIGLGRGPRHPCTGLTTSRRAPPGISCERPAEQRRGWPAVWSTLAGQLAPRALPPTRDPRPRQLPTIPCHAVRASAPTREYQSDSPSTPPVPPLLRGPLTSRTIPARFTRGRRLN